MPLCPLRLGASLYVPATHTHLLDIANGVRLPQLRSVIFCTEDAIRPDEVSSALSHLAETLPHLQPTDRLRFIRVRNPHILGQVMMLPGIGNIDGFVLPKTTADNLPHYLESLTTRDRFVIMPTLETVEVFDDRSMRRFADAISADHVRGRVLSLRIGGNDLLHLLRVRRSPLRTIYDTALGPVISRLATTFIPRGFNLTAPVFEGLRHPTVLRDEVERDLLHGLFGKTAVHPDQIAEIERLYAVTPEDLEMATRMRDPDAPAVFRLHDTMCEEATHRHWAESIVRRAEVYGTTDPGVALPDGAGLPSAMPVTAR